MVFAQHPAFRWSGGLALLANYRLTHLLRVSTTYFTWCILLKYSRPFELHPDASFSEEIWLRLSPTWCSSWPGPVGCLLGRPPHWHWQSPPFSCMTPAPFGMPTWAREWKLRTLNSKIKSTKTKKGKGLETRCLRDQKKRNDNGDCSRKLSRSAKAIRVWVGYLVNINEVEDSAHVTVDRLRFIKRWQDLGHPLPQCLQVSSGEHVTYVTITRQLSNIRGVH